MKRNSWKVLGIVMAINFVGVAFLPRRVTSFYPPRRHTVRGVTMHIARSVLFIFVLHRWAVPWMKANVEQYQRANAELTERLGRGPTAEELSEYVERVHDG